MLRENGCRTVLDLAGTTDTNPRVSEMARRVLGIMLCNGFLGTEEAETFKKTMEEAICEAPAEETQQSTQSTQ